MQEKDQEVGDKTQGDRIHMYAHSHLTSTL